MIFVPDSEVKRVLKEAQYQGARSGLEELKTQVKNSLSETKPREASRILAETKEVEEAIMNLQRDLAVMSKDILPTALDKKMAAMSTKILSVDLQSKIERQKFVATQLEIVLDLLLDLAAGQEVLGGAIQNEADFLDKLEDLLQHIKQTNIDMREKQERLQAKSEESAAREERNMRNTLMPWDKALLSLHTVASGKGMQVKVDAGHKCIYVEAR